MTYSREQHAAYMRAWRAKRRAAMGPRPPKPPRTPRPRRPRLRQTPIFPRPGHATTPEVMARTGLTHQRLRYALARTALGKHMPNKGSHWEWPFDTVRRLEITHALSRATGTPFPRLVDSVLEGPTPPETGWVRVGPDGSITYTDEAHGSACRVPLPWELAPEGRPSAPQEWAVIEERSVEEPGD